MLRYRLLKINKVTFYGFPSGGEEPLREGWTEVQQQAAANQDDQQDLTIGIIAVQETTYALAELAAVQHAAGSHRESFREPV